MPYAFFSHETALSALRCLDALPARWPSHMRTLPPPDHCVHNQRGFSTYATQHDLAALGIPFSDKLGQRGPAHLLVADESARARGKHAVFHLSSEPLPAHSFIRIGQDALVASPELVILQLAQSRFDHGEFNRKAQRDAYELKSDGLKSEGADDPFVWGKILQQARTARIACELAGSYRLGTDERDIRYKAKPLTSIAKVIAFLDQLPGAHGTTITRAALAMAFDGSASPMETALVIALTFPVEFGGFGLPKPLLNKSVEEGLSVMPDMLWEGPRLVLEYDSYEFHEGLGSEKVAKDADRANALTAAGFRVLRATRGNVQSMSALTRLAEQIASMLGIGLQTPTSLQLGRRQRLLVDLLTPMAILP